jgi:cysteine desulfurase/selenocysteine lyase
MGMANPTAERVIKRVTSVSTFDPLATRRDFPILSTTANGRPLVYLDNGATTQKPRAVIEAVQRYYAAENANIHRGVYQLSQTATRLYEDARRTVQRFLSAADEREVIFTRGTTDGINLVAASWGRANLHAGDVVVVSAMEHHSNIVPWQMICQATGADLRVIPMTDAGELRLDAYADLLAGGRVRIVACTHLSNALGTINDAKRITTMAHAAGAVVLIDGAQWVAHHPTDVRDIGCDFYVFSGHKLFGPTGIGVLYGRRQLLDAMPPYQGGGDMVERVTFERTTYAQLPNKFEAGTPNIAGAVGLGAAIDYLSAIGFDAFEDHERRLLAYATERLATVPGVRIVGTAAAKGSVISFVIDDPPIGSYDVGVALDRDGVAVRTGHHCCQPVMDRFGIASTARASFAMYNTTADVDALVASLRKLVAAAPAAKPTAPKQDVAYPAASAASPAAAAQLLADDFEFLGDNESRNQYVIDLGNGLPDYFELLKKVTPRVAGCMSEVYLVARRSPADPARVEFVADANSAIVRGLIAVLEKLFAGQRAADILAFDVNRFFDQIGLGNFISGQRRNGLEGMIRRLREFAATTTVPHE